MSALVTGEPDSVEPPMRRLTVITVSGIMIAIVVAAVFAVIGLLRGGGGDDWKAEGSVIMEEETGARFVMVEGTLHPVLNYASAVLASGASGEVQIHSVSRSDLGSVERGATIGVPGLPDSLPAADDLVGGPITVCSQAQSEGVEVTAVVDVEIGSDEPSTMMAASDALYVESFDGKRFLLYDGQRHLVADEVEAVLQISQDPVQVGSAFLTAIPMGAPFQTPEIEDVGAARSEAGRNMRVGQLIEVEDGTFRVLLADGVAPVTDVQAKLLRTVKIDGQRRDPIPMSLSDVLGMDDGGDLGEQMDALPEQMPAVSSAAGEAFGACAVFDEDATAPRFAVPDGTPPGRSPGSESDASRHGSADHVSLEPGAALVATVPGAQTVYVIGEPGRAYPASSLEVLAGFGYGGVDPVPVPAELLDIIPGGDALDPGDARMSASQ